VLENQHFEFVICDVFMPQISGLVVANIITHYFGSALPLLLMSSNKFVGVFIPDQVRPGWDFVGKPISAAELHQFITKRMPGHEEIRPN
jgi:FixJ family two-component response regulator